ncbi:type I polyketide synthase [Mycolicibacterium sediminis]|uniref:Phthiocerol synthesis polyketide synthase type I PpsE n=1 Tax=Mycolicibacterium sediminis TaxID=1286180 RepID=A0A7I7QTM6_9MYCO|nr:type I polyketide synthase [Mycolicibacterium sediminis]BBY29236.1 phthiocerol synthesis polyketide synthase type I PpsE [Mycolicibacterium sediminis]
MSSTTEPSSLDSLDAIAVVGMAGKFPGAESLSEFWRNLRDGVESIVGVSERDLVAAGVTEAALANPAYVRRAPLMKGIDEFDAEFFGFTPQAARMMDPQHRQFLQCAWHALEDAGFDPKTLESTVGVYGTSSASGYLLHNLMSHHDPHRIMGQGASFDMINLSMQNDKDYLTTRVAHQFDLRGPAISVQTACSSSLVAVHMACQSLLSGETEIALAGASSIRVPHDVGYWHEPGSMASASGHCRPFDVRADGTVFGSGVAIVVLKPLQAALEDGDRIRAVIRGSAINNDGSTKMNYAAPNAAGQAEVIAEAHAIAEVDASTISYVETHGTGTPLGDPIEIEGLRQAFELSTETRQGPCVIGSVKSNIGHLEVASGIAGLIKAVLCLEHAAIPPTLHYTSPNPELHLDRGPFQVAGELRDWTWDGPRRAGVSSFGVGGTNVHVVLEEAPQAPPARDSGKPAVLLLSARSADGIDQARHALAAELSDPRDSPALPDVAYTLRERRTERVRMAAVVADRADAARVLGSAEHDDFFVGEAVSGTEGQEDRVAFVFPGQGAQHVGMARGLYDSEPVFAAHFDECAAGFGAELGIDLRAEVFDGTAANLERTDRTQPALFSVEYALAKLLESYGVVPDALAGHSVGEYVAATLAGVFDLPTAIKAVSLRARLMHAAPRGVMVAVARSHAEIAEYIGDDVDLATVNDPGSCVVAGSEDAIRSFQERLTQVGISARRVRTSHAFHSRLMDGVVPEFRAFMSRLTLNEPRIPLLSNVTGTWMTAAEATDPATWATQIRSTVRFADELDVLLSHPSRVVVEVGPSGTLTSSAARHTRWSPDHRAVRLMRHHAQERNDRDVFLLGLGALWSADVEVDWSPLAGDTAPQRVSLPGYPFARERHWVEYAGAGTWGNGSTVGGAPASAPAAHTGAVDGVGNMEATLQRIWAQCLGLGTIDAGANFFDIGGDSLVAISVAMTASNEGLDLTPQDVYENQTIGGLAKMLTARYEGGLSRQTAGDSGHSPVPPNVVAFLEHGLREPDRWRIPLLLNLAPHVTSDHVRAVLAAVVDHHDALRVRVVEQAGTWEQRVVEPGEFTALTTASLPAGLAPGSPEERQAVRDLVDEHLRAGDGVADPLHAILVQNPSDGSSHLVLSLHGTVGDAASRDVLLGDLFTAFGQRLAGHEIELARVATSWEQWSQRCAALATHPAVIESRDYWLRVAGGATLDVARAPDRKPGLDDLARISTVLTDLDTERLDDARRELRIPVGDVLLAALGRVLASQFGDGVATIDVEGQGRSVLKPDVDLRRTVGSITTTFPMALSCDRRMEARELLDGVRDGLTAVPHYGIGYGLLRYVFAPTARQLAATRPADVLFTHAGAIPDLPPTEDSAVALDADTAMPVRDAPPGLGHALELRAFRSAGVLHLDWWYDTGRIEPAVVEALSAHFPTALADLVIDVMAQAGFDAGDELELIDLSSPDIGSELHA